MPWCEPCSRYLAKPTLGADGACPTCGEVVEEPPKPTKVPWHFWMLVGALTLYLGWRLIQGIGWLVGLV